jgi:hypothetical protein
MTAMELHTAIRYAGITLTIEGDELVLSAPPPPGLAGYLSLLHTGIRAIIRGRKWYGIDQNGRGCSDDGTIDPREKIPSSVYLLSVGSESSWHHIDNRLRDEVPNAFDFLINEKKRAYAQTARRAKV